MIRKLSIAIVSDLHAHTLAPNDPTPKPSFLSLHGDSDPSSNPIEGLKHRIKEDGLTADALFCAGDMGDKADHAAQTYVWDQIQQIGSLLKAPLVVGTAGNHDMDSRHTTEIDAKGILQSLTPMFPGLEEAECDRYWSRNYVIHEETDWRLLLLNSAAYHGGALPEKAQKDAVGSVEYEHGRVSSRTLAALKRDLKDLAPKGLNVLLCHHHPMKNDELASDSDYSEMVGGDLLVSHLSESTCGDWLIIHGHKHLPRLWYAGGSTGRTPVILSAGSLSAKLYAEIQVKARNQFYIIDIDLDEIVQHAVGVVGEVRAWDWSPSIGWQDAGAGSSIPKRTGFGWRENPQRSARTLAEWAKDVMKTETLPYVPWERVRRELPFVRYLNSPSFGEIKKFLVSDHNLKVLEDQGEIDQIGPKQ